MSTNVLNVPGNYIIRANNGTITAEAPTTVITGNIDVRGSPSTVIIKPNDSNTGNPYGIPYDPTDIYGTQAQRLEAAVYVGGGVGIEKDLNVGGFIYGRIEYSVTTTNLEVTGTNVDLELHPTFVESVGNEQFYIDQTGIVNGLTYNPAQGRISTDRMVVAEGDNATDETTGALQVKGGASVTKDLFVGEDITANRVMPKADNTGTIGTSSTQWAESYINDIYTKIIRSTTGTVRIDPKSNLTEIIGDINVRGVNPIGTAPVVTNTLYVTMDGNDTNDGRAIDSSRACRTIGGALNSPYYQPGTQILVSAGYYLEDNPLRLKPYTSIRGSDIRTTFIEPINKTQDLFHLDSGCYLNYMTFLNGRSGLLEGPYAAGFNRGAYATAFPPLEGDDRIDLFHSPYVQNCTNQSGPWLKDGTMFVPNQTVQVPAAVGTGTWEANTTSIVVTVSSGTVIQGMTINAGQQNPGFFNARTLLLANKPFLQEQVVKYVNDTFPGFEYNQEKCYRDVGILVENVGYDAAFGGNQKAVESGLAYYDGVVSLIAGQETQTTAAIAYLNTLVNQVVTNTTATDLYFDGFTTTAKHPQVINWVLTGGEISTASYNSLFSTITNIINNGPSVAPSVYKSPGPDAAFVSAEILMQANREFIQQDTINWINNTFLTFPYSEIKCRRDTGLIIDAIAVDLLYPTAHNSQSTFAGLQYWSQDAYVGAIQTQLTETVDAIGYLKDLARKIILNITPVDDLVDRYQTVYTQNTSLPSATETEVNIIEPLFDIIIEIVNGNKTGWTGRIIPNSTASNLFSVQNAVELLQANKTYLGYEVTAFVDDKYPSLVYDAVKCRRDVGYMIDSVCFDLLHGGNRQSIQAGLYYYGFDGTESVIENEETQTIAAFNYLASIAQNVIRNIPVAAKQDKVLQTYTQTTATVNESNQIAAIVSTITNIIASGPGVAAAPDGIGMTASLNLDVVSAYNNLYVNKEFLIEEVIAFIDQTYNPTSFNYDEAKCYRDVGLIIDAVSQDIVLGGNQKSIEAGLAYWSAGYNAVTGQETTTTMALNHAKDIALKVIANQPVTPQTGTIITQIINPFFQYGGDYMPQEAVKRNFKIITDIIEKGPLYAPPRYAGGGLFALTGINGADVKIAPKVTEVTDLGGNEYLIGLSEPTIGFGNNATLYFGDTLIFPYRDHEVEEKALEFTGDATSWNHRKVDPIGSMGGSLVDGAVISDRSPIQSFVYDAFTQVNQGGRGVHITNDGYAQLVSVFTIFCSTGVQVDNGGIASIVNSNANFGNICLLAKGYGKRKFSGTVYNPPFKAYPAGEGFDQYYPNGFWPNGGRIRAFIPDLADRPHISLVMEIVAPEGHLNEQQLPGFLNANPNTSTLTTGTITIEGIDTDGIAIGNYLYVRDQYGKTTDDNGVPYVATGTIVTDIGYQSVTLNFALTSGGSDPGNTENSINNNYFDLYFCGNAYYTVLSSEVGDNPLTVGERVIPNEQVAPHIDSLEHLNDLVNQVINNDPIVSLQTGSTATTQTINVLVTGGSAAQTFIDLRFDNMIDIISAADLTAAEAVIPPSLRTQKGPTVQGAGSAITLIKANIEFLADEVSAYVKTNYPALVFNEEKCQRDVKIILQRLIYDIETGGRYNSVMSGLSYWQRNGTHHIIQLGENVRRTDLFPDGATLNFYQRSYMSASGYVFEYVGAGIDYGALPQRGVADPVQGKEVVMLDSGKVFFTSTDQNGDFRIGPGLVISQATGVLSGRTFTKSLFANMTPFILAIEGGGT